jgi:Carboxypeptidase regulatory-like domain
MRGFIHRARLFVVFAALCWAANTVMAQGTSASLTGQVTDTTGAVIPSATIIAKNADTDLTQTASSNGTGTYLLGNLPPGRYTLTVEAPGFQRYVQMGIELVVNVASTQNIALKPGNTQEAVTVTSDAELINTSNAELGTTINADAVTQLPLNGRDPSSLVFLAPGVTNVLNSSTGALQTGFSFPQETGGSANGGRQGSTYYLLDGVPNMDTYLSLTAPFPNADATQEFRVISNNFSVVYGFAPGAVVSIETKAGTNKYHGGVFEFLRNQDLNATNWFTGAVDTLHRNQFGGFIGGPIRKDKLFLFLNYQGTRSSSAAASNFSQTPTAAMLNGDFSGITQPLNAPFATVNGVPNQINPSLFNPIAVTVAKTTLPLGQQADGGVYYSTGTTINNLDEGTARLDYNISDKQRLSLRSYVNSLIQPSSDVPGNILSMVNLNNWAQTFAMQLEYFNEALNHTWTITPTTVNQLSVFWTQMSAHSGSQAMDSSGQPFCWSRYINESELPGTCYLEGFSASNGFNAGYYEPSEEDRTTYGVYDNLTKSVGNHTFSFGADVEHQYAYEYSEYPIQPIIDFDGQYTNNGLADFLLGDMASYTQGAGAISPVSGWRFGIYGQDQFRLRPNIAIIAGLRWDPNSTPPATIGAAFRPGQQSTQFPNAPEGLVFPGDTGITSSLMPATYGYLEPRVGVAWQPKLLPHTSIRGGFGLFTNPLPYSMYGHTGEIAPYSPTFNLNGSATTPLDLDSPWAGFAGTGGVSPFPPFASTSYKPPSTSTFALPMSIPSVFSPNFRLGMTQSWNATVEHEFGGNMFLRVAYVGSESYHEAIQIDQNPGVYASGGTRSIYPNFGQILTDFSNGTASYNGLQVTFERHLSHGLQFQSNYTRSKAIDTASTGNIAFFGAVGDPFDLRWNRGIADVNVPNLWVSNFIYQAPKLQRMAVPVREVFGGWELSAIITAQSGSPFTVGAGFGGDNSESLQYGDRADLVPGQPLNVRKGGRSNWLNNYFNVNAFTVNAPGTFGNSGRNMLTGPPVNSTDSALAKNWSLVEGCQLQFRWEMFNALNHPNFGVPGSTNGSGSAEGQITNLGSVAPRVMQGGLKLTF